MAQKHKTSAARNQFHDTQEAIPLICVNESDAIHAGLKAHTDKRAQNGVGVATEQPHRVHEIQSIFSESERWFDSSRTLLTLDTSVLLGSTTSLESCYTSRSLGLLSDDSDSRFQSERPSLPGSPTRRAFKRLYSYPDDSPPIDLTINRSVHSWNDLHTLAAGLYVSSDADVRDSLVDDNRINLPIWSRPRPNSSSDMSELQRHKVLSDLCEGKKFVCTPKSDREIADGKVRHWLQELHKSDETLDEISAPVVVVKASQ